MSEQILFWGFFVGGWLAALLMLFIVPFRRHPEAAKDWLLLILYLPWLGLLLFFLIGAPKPTPQRRQRDRAVREATTPIAARLAEHEAARRIRPALAPEAVTVVELAQRLGRHPVLDGNHIELLDDYNASLDRLAADIDAARHHVHLMFYIFADDGTGRRFASVLAQAAARGVRCRVLVDEAGSFSALRTLVPAMRDSGIEVQVMLPMGHFRGGGRADLRNHRKIAVIDGAVAYTGSQNIVDGELPPGVVSAELMVRVRGPAVLELQTVFVHDWYLECERLLVDDEIFPQPQLAGDAAAQVVPSGPLYPTENVQRLLVSLIHGARRRVVITTPYLIPDAPLLQAMETAVLRGVEVFVILSKISDQPLVILAQQSYYKQLLDAGIGIRLYRDRFLHAKHVTIDDAIALIGSSNIDIRSFELNEEITLMVYDTALNQALQRLQARYLQHSDTLTVRDWERRPLYRKALENTARLFSPLF